MEEDVSRIAAINGGRLEAVGRALVTLVEASWPHPASVQRLRKLPAAVDDTARARILLDVFDALQTVHPTAHFWWKDEASAFLGTCRGFAAAGGVSRVEMLRRTDDDPKFPWSRQALLYVKDDRDVMRSGAPKLDIVERQDRVEGTIWLRTSKAPYRSSGGDGTVGGFDTITVAEAQRIASRTRG